MTKKEISQPLLDARTSMKFFVIATKIFAIKPWAETSWRRLLSQAILK